MKTNPPIKCLFIIIAFLLYSCSSQQMELEHSILLSAPDQVVGINLKATLSHNTPTIVLTFARTNDILFGPFQYGTEEYKKFYCEYYSKVAPAEEYLKETLHKQFFGDDFIDCCIDGSVSLTADSPLFGRVAGENLVDIATITEITSNGLICQYPDFNVLGIVKIEDSLGSLFPEGCYLPMFLRDDHCPYLYLAFSLPECHSGTSFTLSLDIPISGDGWLKRGFEYTLYNSFTPLPDNRTLHGEVVITIP